MRIEKRALSIIMSGSSYGGRYLQIFGQNTFGTPPSLLVQHIFEHYDFRKKLHQLIPAS